MDTKLSRRRPSFSHSLGRELTVDHHRSSRMALTICCPNTDCYHEPLLRSDSLFLTNLHRAT
jgi:hypothetical protein